MNTCKSFFKIKTLLVWGFALLPVLCFSQTGKTTNEISQEEKRWEHKEKQERKNRLLANENKVVFDAANPAKGQPNNQEIFDIANQKLLYLRVLDKPTEKDLERIEELEKKIQKLCHILELEDCNN